MRVVLVTVRMLVLTEIEKTQEQRWKVGEACVSDAKFAFGLTELELKERYSQMEVYSSQNRGVHFGSVHRDVIVDAL